MLKGPGRCPDEMVYLMLEFFGQRAGTTTMTTDETETTSSASHTQGTGKKRGCLLQGIRFIAGFLGACIIWGGISWLIPAIPSPLATAKAMLLITKAGADKVYFAFNTGALEEASKRVEQEATDAAPDRQLGFDSASFFQNVSIPAERQGEVDSAFQSVMKNLSKLPSIGGRVVNVAVIGVDSRLGETGARSDAIHLFTFSLDSGVVEIMSVPRETPCDLGHGDSSRLNIVSYARQRGVDFLLRKLEPMCRRGPIKYWAEVGFSQAMGIIELLGYSEPQKTLRFLRSRKAFGLGDWQRSHNQSVFLRENLVRKFSLLTGASGDVILTAGLQFVNTNMTKDFVQGIVYGLQKRGFPQHRYDAVRVKMVPLLKFRLEDVLPDSVNLARVATRSDRIIGDDHAPGQNVEQRLVAMVRQAAADSARPAQVIRRLKVVVDQHAWMQVQNKPVRWALRDEMIMRLERAYRRLGKNAEAERVVAIKTSEDVLRQNIRF